MSKMFWRLSLMVEMLWFDYWFSVCGVKFFPDLEIVSSISLWSKNWINNWVVLLTNRHFIRYSKSCSCVCIPRQTFEKTFFMLLLSQPLTLYNLCSARYEESCSYISSHVCCLFASLTFPCLTSTWFQCLHRDLLKHWGKNLRFNSARNRFSYQYTQIDHGKPKSVFLFFFVLDSPDFTRIYRAYIPDLFRILGRSFSYHIRVCCVHFTLIVSNIFWFSFLYVLSLL